MQQPGDPPSPAPPPNRWVLFGFGLVGVAMFLGFGAIAVSGVLTWRKLSHPPQEIAVREAVRPGLAESEAWVRLRDVRVPCDVASQRPNETSLYYRLASDAAATTWVVLESSKPIACVDAPAARTGTLRGMAVADVIDLVFPERPWATWPERRVIFVDVDATPVGELKNSALIGVMALLGLLIARFYFGGFRRQGAAPDEMHLGAPDQRLPDGSVLPARALEYHRATAGKPAYVVGFLLVCAAMFGMLASTSLPSRGGDSVGAAFGWGVFLFFMALAAFLVWLSYRFLGVTRRQRRILQPDRIERWLPLESVQVDHAKGVDVGNRSFLFEHPRDGSITRLVLGVDEAPPWVVEDHVLVVHPPGEPDVHHVVRVNGAPFALTREEVAALGARLAALE